MADIAGCNLPVLNPPSNAKLQKLQSFYDIDKGHLVKITIVDKPADLTDLCNWIAYRKSIGKPIHAGLRHNNHLACKLIEIKMHNEHSPVFIHPETMDVYIDADKHRKMSKHDAVAFKSFFLITANASCAFLTSSSTISLILTAYLA
ncbi:MAG: hypothetical protein DRN12_03830, partial [Thermoplasmata archaeon]